MGLIHLVRSIDDVFCIIGGFLHDIVEYNDTAEDMLEKEREIERLFGKDVAYLVKNVAGLTGLDGSNFKFKDNIEFGNVERLRNKKYLLLDSQYLRGLKNKSNYTNDPRILLIRISDVIDNTKTLRFTNDLSFIKWYLDENSRLWIPLAKQAHLFYIANQLKHETDKEKSILLGTACDIFNLDIIDVNLYHELTKNPELLREMNWRLFEKLLADILNTFGYEIDLKRGTKDGGVDLFAIKKTDELGPHKYLLQAKRYSNRVGVEPIRQLLGLHFHHRVTKSCLATTATFTRGAFELANEYQWQLELKDYEGLKDWIQKASDIKVKGI